MKPELVPPVGILLMKERSVAHDAMNGKEKQTRDINVISKCNYYRYPGRTKSLCVGDVSATWQLYIRYAKIRVRGALMVKLKKSGKNFKRNMLKKHKFTYYEDRQKLDMVAHTVDRLQAFDDVIEQKGVILTDKQGNFYANPAIHAETELKKAFFDLVDTLFE